MNLAEERTFETAKGLFDELLQYKVNPLSPYSAEKLFGYDTDSLPEPEPNHSVTVKLYYNLILAALSIHEAKWKFTITDLDWKYIYFCCYVPFDKKETVTSYAGNKFEPLIKDLVDMYNDAEIGKHMGEDLRGILEL